MKLILHIGMQKTGTTALQAQLAADRSLLLRHGVLYPQVNIHPTNHNFLALMLREDGLIESRLRAIYRDRHELLRRDIDDNWRQIRRQVEKHAPHTVILSGEVIFNRLGMVDGHEFRDRMLELTADVEIVAYVRQPSRYYLSVVQQRLKSSATLIPPGPLAIRRNLEAAERLFGRKPVVVPYERSTLRDGDITRDFLYRQVPELADFSGSVISAELNESMSAEAMALLQAYRQVNHPSADGAVMADCVRFQRLLQRLEKSLDLYRRPQLRREVADYIDHSSIELLWLRDEYGCCFNDVDYGAIRDMPAAEWARLDKVADICQLDANRRLQLEMHALRMLAMPRLQLPQGLMHWLVRHAGSMPVRWARRVLGWCGRKSTVTR